MALSKLHRVHGLKFFLLQLKVREKCLPVAFGLLPDKEQKSYETFFELIITYLRTSETPNNVEKIISDFETGILKALIKIWPNLNLQGCRFHYAQAIQRWTDSNLKESLANPEFEKNLSMSPSNANDKFE